MLIHFPQPIQTRHRQIEKKQTHRLVYVEQREEGRRKKGRHTKQKSINIQIIVRERRERKGGTMNERNICSIDDGHFIPVKLRYYK